MAWSTFLGSGNVGSASTSAKSFGSSEQSTSTFVFIVFLSASDGLITQIHAGFFLFDLSYKLHSRDNMAHSFLLCVCFSDDVFLTCVHKTQGYFLPQNERVNAC